MQQEVDKQNTTQQWVLQSAAVLQRAFSSPDLVPDAAARAAATTAMTSVTQMIAADLNLKKVYQSMMASEDAVAAEDLSK